MKKEFTEEELYEQMKYIVYCLETNRDMKPCSSHEAYQELLKDAHRHIGDCTKEPSPCSRCFLISVEIEAQNAVDILMSNNVGHCGKECVSECNYDDSNHGVP